jgi:two-component system capsular synthesis response regulator RcsB
MSPYVVKVVIADDHPVILEGIRRSITDGTIEITNMARNSTQILQILDRGGVDVLVTDYSMPGGEHGDGLSLLGLLIRRYPKIRIVVMTMMDNAGLLRTLVAAGVRCMVSKSDSVSCLIPAIHSAYVGGQYFSPNIETILHSVDYMRGNEGKQVRLSVREQEVLRLYATGMSINDVAMHLHRSKQTISSQKNSAMRKIGVATDADLFKYMLEVGFGSFPAASRSSV